MIRHNYLYATDKSPTSGKWGTGNSGNAMDDEQWMMGRLKHVGLFKIDSDGGLLIRFCAVNGGFGTHECRRPMLRWNRRFDKVDWLERESSHR
jgi:hypothetical protein